MRIAGLADLHLGHRRYAAITERGRNRREQDVSDAFAIAVDQIVNAKPDLALIAGDVFDRPNPGNLAIRDAAAGVRRLVDAGIRVAIVEGNHDGPKVEEGGVGTALLVLAQVGAHVFRTAQRLSIPSLNCHVLCVPDRHIRNVDLAPSDAPGIHILLAHGSIGGRLAKLPGVDVLPAEAISDAFDICILGDYHSTERVARNAWYCGAIEFTSSDPWREIGTPHGFLLVDTDAGTVEHQAVPTRRFLDLPQLSAHDATAEDVAAKILANVSAVDLTGAVVRQVVTECLRSTRKAIDPRAIRKATVGALHFQLDVREPEDIRIGRPTELLKEPEPDWIDGMNAEDDTPVAFDGVTDAQVNAWLANPLALRDACARNPDPYGLDVKPQKRKSAA